MVEHNLAKVGVASSNLVSRSILFLLLFISSLVSQPLYIDKTYCIEEDTLRASFFGYQSNDNPIIVTIPKERTHYSVPTNTIRSAFSDRNVTIIDSSDGVVIFKRNCTLMGKADAIEEAFLKKFQEVAPSVMIDEKPRISIKTSLPADFKRYELVDIHISDAMLKRNSGSFVAIFKVGDREKKLYFTYEINAKVKVFKAKRNLLNGKILTNDDYESVWVSLDTPPTRAILNEIPQNVVIKNGIKEGQILTDFHFDVKKVLSKKESIKALFKEEGLVIEVQATLLEDGNVGDIVKIKTEQGKILNAKILSRHEAIILE
ncbi:MAG: FlgA protein [Proteobacteria bacterium]|nr:FlgA protein [Pseudomonadota bacterium]